MLSHLFVRHRSAHRYNAIQLHWELENAIHSRWTKILELVKKICRPWAFFFFFFFRLCWIASQNYGANMDEVYKPIQMLTSFLKSEIPWNDLFVHWR